MKEELNKNEMNDLETDQALAACAAHLEAYAAETCGNIREIGCKCSGMCSFDCSYGGFWR